MQMNKFTFAILIIIFVCCFNTNAQIAQYGQCGGLSFSGPYICASGLKCYKKDAWFAQCLTSCPAAWECNNPLVALNGQCGGSSYCGLTSCDGGLTCFRKDSTYSACLYNCKNGWECKGVLLTEYSQCGGLGYTGNTKCAGSLKCYAKDKYYSQCLSYCPSGWNCTNCTRVSTTTLKTTKSLLTTLLTTTQKPITTSTSAAKTTTSTLKPTTVTTTSTLAPVTTNTTTTTTQTSTTLTSTTLTTSSNLITTTTLVTVSSNDQITYVDYGGKIASEDQLDIYFKYNSDADRSATVSLIKPSESNKVYATKTVAINGGSNKNRAVTLTRSTSTPVGLGYTILIQFFNSNNALTTSYSVSVTVEAGKQGFHCYQGKIYDANKSEFLMRGINNMHAYWDNYNRWYAYNALDNIALTGANVVRIVWLKYLQGGVIPRVGINKVKLTWVLYLFIVTNSTSQTRRQKTLSLIK